MLTIIYYLTKYCLPIGFKILPDPVLVQTIEADGITLITIAVIAYVIHKWNK